MDEDIYTNPAEFIPERFIQSESSLEELPMDPRAYVFGIGRRYVIHAFFLVIYTTPGSPLSRFKESVPACILLSSPCS